MKERGKVAYEGWIKGCMSTGVNVKYTWEQLLQEEQYQWEAVYDAVVADGIYRPVSVPAVEARDAGPMGIRLTVRGEEGAAVVYLTLDQVDDLMEELRAHWLECVKLQRKLDERATEAVAKAMDAALGPDFKRVTP